MTLFRLLLLLTCGLGVAPLLMAAAPTVVPVPRPQGEKWVEIEATRGRMLTLSSEPASKWLAVDDEGCDLRPTDAGKFADFCAPTNGRYRVIVTGPDGTPTKIVIVVGDKDPDPVVPPKPKPDALAEKLRKAFADATDADKAESVKLLSELYKQIAEIAAKSEVETAAELMSKARETAALLLKPTQLAALRKVVSEELAAIFPKDSPLTAASRKAAVDLFTKLSAILEAL